MLEFLEPHTPPYAVLVLGGDVNSSLWLEPAREMSTANKLPFAAKNNAATRKVPRVPRRCRDY